MSPAVERHSLVLRGVLDLCLLALLEEQVVYGYELTQRLADRGLPVAGGSTYPLLARMERQGLVQTEARASTSGPTRKYYSLARRGRRALAEGREEWLETAGAVTALLAPGPPGDTAPSGTSPSSARPAPPGTAPPGTAPPGTAPPGTARNDPASSGPALPTPHPQEP